MYRARHVSLKKKQKQTIQKMESLTEICKRMKGCSKAVTDSGTDKLTWHSYLPVYEEKFSPYRKNAEKVLEVGVQGGGSIVMWQKYFDHAHIFGIELSPCTAMTANSAKMIDNTRTTIYWNTDAYSLSSLSKLKANAPFDIVIDDGPHTPRSQCYFAELYSDLVKLGGLLVVEDIDGMENAKKILDSLPSYMKGEILDLRKVKNRYDDIMIIATRV